MKKIRYVVAMLLAAATLLSLFACADQKGNGDVTSGSDVTADEGGFDNSPAPEWPSADGYMADTMTWPEPTGDVEYKKITVTADMVTSSTPWNNGSDVAMNAFDGSTDTFFDGVENGWIKIDLGERTLIGQIGFAPRSGYESRLNGIFYGSVDGVKWTKIYDIRTAPYSMKRVKYEEFETVAAFRYIRYENTRDCANISELEIYSATNIPPSMITEPDRDLYADGTYEILSIVPEDLGMSRVKIKSGDEALRDNNPSTLSEDASRIEFEFSRAATIGAIVFMSDSSSVGGKFYGVKENGERDLLWEVTEENAPTARKSEVIAYGKLKTTGSYSSLVFEINRKCNMAELKVYSMDADTSISLTALPFATSRENDVDCIALNWGSSLDADAYEIYRKRADGESKLVYTGSGTSWQDYRLPLDTYTYEVHLKYGETVLSSKPVSAGTYEMPNIRELSKISNQAGSDLHVKGGIYDGEKYYSYSVNVNGGRASVVETSGTDGYSYGNARTVVDSSADTLMQSCKIESTKVAYIKEANTVIIAAHWEKPNGYADGKLFLVTGTPGGEFTLRGIWNPLGIEVRDMSIFVDDDNTAYLLAAANVPGQGANATTYVFKFSDDYTDIEEITAQLFENMYREMPNIVKIDGWYYLFVSQTSGWAPSAGAYAVSRNMKTGWSDLRPIGNTSTFGSQSSWILQIGDGENAHYLMHAYRWGPAQGTGVSGTMIAPITFSNGVAYYDYFPEILYDSEKGIMIPITYGQLLSQDAEVTASVPSADGGDPSNIVDGDYNTAYVAGSNTWPFTFEIDLGRECEVSNIQLSWYIMKGSEAFYRYKIYGSIDGSTWDMIRDNTDLSDTVVSKAVGFSSFKTKGKYRYIKVEVIEPRRWQDSSWDSNSVYGESLTWYTPTVYEVKVYGTDSSFKNSAYDE